MDLSFLKGHEYMRDALKLSIHPHKMPIKLLNLQTKAVSGLSYSFVFTPNDSKPITNDKAKYS